MTEPSAPSIQFGVPLDEHSFYFFLSLGAGALIVFLFSWNKFTQAPVDDDDLVVRFPTKYLATRDEYSRAMIVYIATMLTVLATFSLLGPSALTLGGNKTPIIATHLLPFFIALILVGVIPNFPILQEIERNLRRFAHERAYIPSAARATAERMAVAEFDFGLLDKEAILALPSMAGLKRSDFDRPRGSLEYSWARLCTLSYELQSGRAAEFLGPPEEPLWGILEEKRQALSAEVVTYRDQPRGARSARNGPLHERIREMLRTYHRFLGCAVRHKLEPRADINLELRRFGFVLEPASRPEANRGDIIIGGLGVMTASLFLLVLIAATASGFWNASQFFPASALDAFLWCASAVSAHGVAVLIADRMRARAIARNRWYRAGEQARFSPLANLIRVGIVGGIGGYVALILWGIVYQQDVSLTLIKGMAAYAAMPATSGAFYAFHLDNIDLRCRPPRALEISLQASVTAFFGLAACSAWLTLIGDSPRQGYDLIVMVTIFGAIIGGSFAWYVPKAVPETKYDPLGDASADRVLKLEAVAIQYFNDLNIARQWLDRRHARLTNRTPRAAAAESVEGYDDAIGQLDGRQSPLAAKGRVRDVADARNVDVFQEFGIRPPDKANASRDTRSRAGQTCPSAKPLIA